MNKLILTLATALLTGLTAFAQTDFLAGFSSAPVYPPQELSYSVHGRYDRPVYKEAMDRAKLVSDFIDGYPTNWIDEYVSVEIIATNSGKEISGVSANDQLTTEQKNILKAADLSSDIMINVKYKYKSGLTNNSVNQELNIAKTVMNIKLTVIPETEAEYASGQKQMSAYLKESVINKIPESIAKQIKAAQVIFTVNEKGEIEDAKISKTSGDEKTDQLLLESINKMPKWKPAENEKGIKVKQYFQFNVGQYGC
jgi:TonB family protein